MLPFWLGKQPEVQSVSHPELTPLTKEECEYPTFRRDPMLSSRDYSLEEIERAQIQAKGRLPLDMLEYCHNNGISWKRQIREL